jgi:hypothetical protein
MSDVKGYGPSRRPIFDGDEVKYELFETKLLGYLRRLRLSKTILPELEGGVKDEDVDPEDNADVYAELIQCLDDRSLNLILRDAKDDGRAALGILREHYQSNEKPRVIAMYSEFVSIAKKENEDLTDFIIRAETVKAQLVKAGEVISDSLLIAMTLKGLSENYKSFVTMSINQPQSTFQEFKRALRMFEGTMNVCDQAGADSVMTLRRKPGQREVTCYRCGEKGHIKANCPEKVKKEETAGGKKWCDFCRSKSHNTSVCRRKPKDSAGSSAKSCVDETDYDNSFSFKVSVDDRQSEVDPDEMGSGIHAILVDTGATTHIVSDKSKFVTFDNSFVPEKHYIELADGQRTNNLAKGRGTARFELIDSGGKIKEAFLEDALYIPSFKQDIFSVERATAKGASVEFKGDSGVLKTSNGTVFNVKKKGKLYFLNSVVHTKHSTRSVQEWHEAMGHCNVRDLTKMQKCVDGMSIKGEAKLVECKTCIQGKMCNEKCKLPDERATSPLEFVHADLAGPITPTGKDGFKYVLCFTDDYSGVVFTYMLKCKSDTFQATEKFLADVAPHGDVKRLRTDGGGEFMSKQFKALMVKNKIKHETSASYSPHQNGTAERQWRSLFEMSRCMLLDKGLPKYLWPYAVMYSAYTRNRCYVERLGKTPFEALVGKKPNVSHMQCFGQECLSLVQGAKKLDARANEGIFIGYDKYSPAYLVFDPDTQVVRKVRCVKFLSKSSEKTDEEVQSSRPDETREKNPDVLGDDDDDDMHEIQRDADDEPVQGVENRRYPTRERSKPKWLSDYVEKVTDSTVDLDFCYKVGVFVPNTFEQAKNCGESVQWKRAMDDELESLVDNDTFELTSLPKGRKCIGGKWVYAVKQGSDENEVKFKARYVAKGFSQVENIDYEETFSPTAQMSSLRMFIQAAVDRDMSIQQMDVKSAYLNAPIDCELYVKQPKGYQVFDKNGHELVWKLKKSLYGLKQSGRNWNNMLHQTIVQQGYIQSEADPCLYTLVEGNSRVHILVWVDDILVCSNDDEMLKSTKQMLSNSFKMKDLGTINKFLGIEFARTDDGSVTMSQKQYAERVLKRFKMDECNPRSYPMSESYCKDEDETDNFKDIRLYQELVGCLIYMMTSTRPDLSFSVSKLASKMSNPSERDWGAAKDVLRFIKGTVDNKLVFCKSENEPHITGYCDADWAGSRDRKSTTGYVFMTNESSAFVSWKSKKQSIVALSSCEAEYIAMAHAVQEGLFLQKIFVEMYGVKSEIKLHVDNQGAVALSKNKVCQQKSKHIDVKYHFMRSHIETGRVCPVHVPTSINKADALTKPLSGNRLNALLY